MFDAVADFGGLGVVEAVQGADEVAGNTANALEVRATVIFAASALGADIIDNATIAADGVAVKRMVDRTISDAMGRHVTDNLLEGFGIVCHLAIELDVGNVTAVGKCVVGRFEFHLAEGADRIVDRYVEGVGVILAVGDFGDSAETLAVHAHEASGKSLGGRGDKREVQAGLLGGLVGIVAHMLNNLKSELLRFFALGVVLAHK